LTVADRPGRCLDGDRRLGLKTKSTLWGDHLRLARHRPIELLPDREPATAQAWLAGQPQIAIVARDRGGGFALAASKALPGALQSPIAGI
jgi:hypothetical protein